MAKTMQDRHWIVDGRQSQHFPQGLKAELILAALTARLKPCPFTTPRSFAICEVVLTKRDVDE